MKVLLACPYDWTSPGGVQVHVRELAERLRERGHRTLIVAPGPEASSNGVVRIVGRPVRVPYGGTVAPISFSLGAWRRLRSAMRAFAPDVVHVHEPFTPSTSMLATLAATGPVVATFHAFLDRSRLMEVSGPILRQIDRRIDYVLTSPQIGARHAEVVATGASDHLPLVVDLAVPHEGASA